MTNQQAKLISELRQIDDALAECLTDDTDENEQNRLRAKAASIALGAVLESLRPKNDSVALTWLHIELLNASEGATSPLILKGRKKRGAPPMRSENYSRCAFVGQAVLILRPHCRTEAETIKIVAHEFSLAGLKARDGTALPFQTVVEWYGRHVGDQSAAACVLKQSFVEKRAASREEALRQVKRLAEVSMSDALATLNMKAL